MRTDTFTEAGRFKLAMISACPDHATMERLETHLGSLGIDGVEIWSTHALLAGSDESAETLAAVAEADVILVGVSADLFQSPVFPKIQRALLSLRKRGVDVVPLLLRAFDLQGTIFRGLRPLPSTGKPVAEWDCRDAAFEDVVKGLRGVIRARARRRLLPSPWAPHGPRRTVRRRSLAGKVGIIVLAVLVAGATAWALTRPGCSSDPVMCNAGPPDAGEHETARRKVGVERPPRAPDGPSKDDRQPADPVVVKPATGGTPPDENLVFTRVPADIPPGKDRTAPDGAPTRAVDEGAKDPADRVTERLDAADEPTSRVTVVMPPGAVAGTLRVASRQARSQCGALFPRKGAITVSVVFDGKTGGPKSIRVGSSTPLAASAVDCVRSAFAAARMQPFNGDYAVIGWSVQ